MITLESDLLFTGKESDKTYHTTWNSEGPVNTVKVTNRATGKAAEGKSKKALFAIQLALIEALEK